MAVKPGKRTEIPPRGTGNGGRAPGGSRFARRGLSRSCQATSLTYFSEVPAAGQPAPAGHAHTRHQYKGSQKTCGKAAKAFGKVMRNTFKNGTPFSTGDDDHDLGSALWPLPHHPRIKCFGPSPVLGLPSCKVSCPRRQLSQLRLSCTGYMEVAVLMLLNGTKSWKYFAFWGGGGVLA